MLINLNQKSNKISKLHKMLQLLFEANMATNRHKKIVDILKLQKFVTNNKDFISIQNKQIKVKLMASQRFPLKLFVHSLPVELVFQIPREFFRM
jgi:hypothetical protein